MIVYKATKADFIKHVDNDEISIAIERAQCAWCRCYTEHVINKTLEVTSG